MLLLFLSKLLGLHQITNNLGYKCMHVNVWKCYDLMAMMTMNNNDDEKGYAYDERWESRQNISEDFTNWG